MCMGGSKAPPAPAPVPPPPAPPPVLEQTAPESKGSLKDSDKQVKKRKGTKKYRSSALAINNAPTTSGLSIPT